MTTLTAAQERFLPMIVAISLFMQILDASILNTALPTIAKDFDQSALSMQWVVMGYVMVVAMFTPISGFVADKYGTRTTFLLAVSIFTLGSVLCAISPTMNTLIASRMVQGLGGALLVPVAKLILIKCYARERLLKVMNYAVMPALIAPVIGPLLGGYLVEWASWHWIFLINVPIGLAGLWVGKTLIPNHRAKYATMDFVGFGLIAMAMACFGFVLEFAGKIGETDTAFLSMALMLVLAVGLLVAYYFYADNAERKGKNPLFSLKLFWIRTFRVGVVNGILSRLGVGAVPFLLALLFQVGLGYSPSKAGWLIAPMAIGAVLSKFFVTPIVRWVGYKKSLFINSLIIGILIALLSLYRHDTPVWLGVLGLLLLGACNSFQLGSLNVISVIKLRPYQTSSGNSLLSANQQIAITLSIGLAASLLQLFGSGGGSSGQVVQAFTQVFLVLGAITVLSGFYFLTLHKKDGEHRTDGV